MCTYFIFYRCTAIDVFVDLIILKQHVLQCTVGHDSISRVRVSFILLSVAPLHIIVYTLCGTSSKSPLEAE